MQGWPIFIFRCLHGQGILVGALPPKRCVGLLLGIKGQVNLWQTPCLKSWSSWYRVTSASSTFVSISSSDVFIALDVIVLIAWLWRSVFLTGIPRNLKVLSVAAGMHYSPARVSLGSIIFPVEAGIAREWHLGTLAQSRDCWSHLHVSNVDI